MSAAIQRDQSDVRLKAISDFRRHRASLEVFPPTGSWFESLRQRFRAKMKSAGVSVADLLENQERVKRKRVEGDWAE